MQYSGYDKLRKDVIIETEELKPKKPASSHTDNFGKTTYYDEQGNYMGEGFTNAFVDSTYTDSTGNYVGQSVNNGHKSKYIYKCKRKYNNK